MYSLILTPKTVSLFLLITHHLCTRSDPKSNYTAVVELREKKTFFEVKIEACNFNEINLVNIKTSEVFSIFFQVLRYELDARAEKD